MALVLDTGPIVAALNRGDPEHGRCAPCWQAAMTRLVPSPILAEVDYWLSKLGSLRAWADFAADVGGGAYRLIHPSEADLVRAAELELVYADLRLGFVDASVIALCRAPQRDQGRHPRPPTLRRGAAPSLHPSHPAPRLRRARARRSSASVIAAGPVPLAGLQVAVELDAFVRGLLPVHRSGAGGPAATSPALALEEQADVVAPHRGAPPVGLDQPLVGDPADPGPARRPGAPRRRRPRRRPGPQRPR